MRMFSIIRVLDIFFGKGISYKGRYGLLPVVEVHEAANRPLHVALRAGVLELAAELHRLVRGREVSVVDVVVARERRRALALGRVGVGVLVRSAPDEERFF